MTRRGANPFDNAGPDIDGWAKDETPGPTTVSSLAIADMAAFDSLGPLTRTALCGACVMFSALNLTRLISERWPHCRPDHANVDRAVARWIRLADPDIMAKIRVSDEDGLR